MMALHFRPSAQADLAAHAARIADLTTHLVDLPDEYVERACRQWAASKQFFPKPAELIELAKSMLPRSATAKPGDFAGPYTLEVYRDWLNSRNFVQASGSPYEIVEVERGVETVRELHR